MKGRIDCGRKTGRLRGWGRESRGRVSGRKRGGFSLIELLIVIAVAMFVLAIAAASVGGILSRSGEVVAKRNAQHILTVASVVTAAGSDAVSAATDLESAVDRLVAGVRVRFFDGGYQVASLSEEAKLEAMELLRFDDGQIVWATGG